MALLLKIYRRIAHAAVAAGRRMLAKRITYVGVSVKIADKTNVGEATCGTN